MSKKEKIIDKKNKKVTEALAMNGETEPSRKLNFKTSWQYAPAPESTDHFKLKKKYNLFINGKFVKPIDGKYYKTINPATTETLTESDKLCENSPVETFEMPHRRELICHLKLQGLPQTVHTLTFR